MSDGSGVICFDSFRLDLKRGVLEKDGIIVPLRPKSFALLSFLAGHAGRVVSKDEIIEAVWGQLVVTDDTLTQTVKDVRRTIGDDRAEILRTVPKRGYLFASRARNRNATDNPDLSVGALSGLELSALARMVEESVSPHLSPSELRSAELRVPPERADAATRGVVRVSGRSRPAVAVLPFTVERPTEPGDGSTHLRDGLLRDIIRDLSRLRGVLVIAAGSAKALEGEIADPIEAGRLLRVDYVASGTLSVDGAMLRLDVELVAVADGRLLLSDCFARRVSAAARVGAELAAEVARAIEGEIELAERNIAALLPAPALDAWQAYHRGLWHMHRFTGADNLLAASFFERSVDLDPTFARPYAGLSFTHFLKAWFLDPTTLNAESSIAHDLATRAVSVDPHDPSAHAALGRALWLKGAVDEAVESLRRSTAISPNFAFGHYSTGFIEGLSGDPAGAITALDAARELSPFDPFLPPILCTRALALLRLDRLPEAGAWGWRAATQPDAHFHVLRTAVVCMTAAGRHEEVAPLVQRINSESRDNGGEAFIRGLRLKPADEPLIRDLARQSGLL